MSFELKQKRRLKREGRVGDWWTQFQTGFVIDLCSEKKKKPNTNRQPSKWESFKQKSSKEQQHLKKILCSICLKDGHTEEDELRRRSTCFAHSPSCADDRRRRQLLVFLHKFTQQQLRICSYVLKPVTKFSFTTTLNQQFCRKFVPFVWVCRRKKIRTVVTLSSVYHCFALFYQFDQERTFRYAM